MNLSYWEQNTWFFNIDFCIIGSGIVGLNCALTLRKNYPNAKILILEKGQLPQGASTKNAGFEAIEELLEKPEFSPFRYIGSGLQYKFGQTTLARQDKNLSIPKTKSIHLKEEVQKLINKTDPKQKYFWLEDTGKDLEIMLTVSKNDQVEVFNIRTRREVHRSKAEITDEK
jgi:thioredoxin reductase